MFRAVLANLNIAFRKKTFWICMLITVGFVIANYVFAVNEMKGSTIDHIYSPILTYALSSGADYIFYFYEAYSLIVVLPAGMLFLYDIHSDVKTAYISRESDVTYYFSKLICIFIVTFISFTIPFLLSLIMHAVTFSYNTLAVDGSWQPMFSSATISWMKSLPLQSLFYKHPYIYNIILILLVGVTSGIAACFSAAVAVLLRFKFKIFIFIPFYLIVMGTRALGDRIGREEFNLYNYLVAYNTKTHNYYLFAGFLLVLILMTCFFTFVAIKRGRYNGK